tara:strand:- start:2262 stop:3776 length:1515 start_codon:yes stop_codon:yes gene_type:complete
LVFGEIMTVPSEQYSVVYQGSGTSAEGFPIPFSFRHSDILKVETIASDGTATARTLNSHYKLYQRNTTQGSDPVADGVRTEHGWVEWIGTSPTDVVHIYREETPLQTYDYIDGAATPTSEFEKSKDRIVDSMTNQLARDNNDPSAFGAMGRKITSLANPVRNDDILTKDVLDDMQTTASLTIPASGGASDNGKLLTPSTLAPSVPVASWNSRLGQPLGGNSGHVLSPVSDYANSPYVEWTSPRWITAPPNDGKRYVYSYGTGTSIEGEGTTKSALWREFREVRSMAQTGTTGQENHVLRLENTTWSSSVENFSWGAVDESPSGTAAALAGRMVATKDGTIVNSPRFKLMSKTLDLDAGEIYGSTFGNGDGTMNRSGTIGDVEHPGWVFNITNTLVNDSGSEVMPKLLFLQVKCEGKTVTDGIHYPVMHPRCNAIDGTSTFSEFLYDSGSDDIDGSLELMNMNQHLIGNTSTGSSTYFHWGSGRTGSLEFTVYALGIWEEALGQR